MSVQLAEGRGETLRQRREKIRICGRLSDLVGLLAQE